MLSALLSGRNIRVLTVSSVFNLSLERGEGREEERGRNIDVGEKHQLAASRMHPNQEPNPQPRHVP